MENKKWLVYFEGKDEELLKILEEINNLEKYVVLLAGNGYKQNLFSYVGILSETEDISNRLDSDQVVYTNDINLLDFAEYDEQIKNFRLSFLIDKQICDLSSFYLTLNSKTSVQKLYKLDSLKTFDVKKKIPTIDLIYLDTYTNSFVKYINRFEPTTRYIETCANEKNNDYIDLFLLSDGATIEIGWNEKLLLNLNINNTEDAYNRFMYNVFKNNNLEKFFDTKQLVKRYYPREKYITFLSTIK